MAYPLIIQWVKALQAKMTTAETNITNITTNTNISNTQITNARLTYGSCVTDGSAPFKLGILTDFTLAVGSEVKLKFQYENTASNPTLNVNNTGAKPIKVNGINVEGTDETIQANTVCHFVYDGINWNLTNPFKKDIDLPLAISNGGTGRATSPSIRTNLSSEASALVLDATPRPGIEGILAIEHGGTGNNIGDMPGNANTASQLETGRTIAVTDNSTSGMTFTGTEDITIGVPVVVPDGTATMTLPSTSTSTLRAWLSVARNNLKWLMARFNTSGQALVAVSATTANTLSTTLPVNKGGTGSTTQAAALTALGVKYGTTAYTSGSTALTTGTFYFQYK